MIFFHGWGMHSGVFKPVVDELQAYFKIVLVDLPGHGLSQPFAGFGDIDKCSEYLFEYLQAQIDDKVILCGWSTGSLIAQQLAIRYPELVSRLVLITGTPAFVKKPDWSCAVDIEVLEKFRNDLLSNFDKTLNRFLALQFMHSDGQKENLRLAKELVFARPTPDLDMLQAGLQLLKSTDLRDQLADIQCPVLILNGERDSLVPTSSARYLAEEISQSKAIIFKSCGHAPFLSHGKQFIQYVKAFLT
ncbi:MAG: pimeloyl-ACP methyl ester esterase BioH [Thioalkalispiraceae bacterium]